MKTPKSQTDSTPAYMAKGATNKDSQNAPKGTGFAESETKPSPDVSVGMQQHRKAMNKFGTRHGGPNESLHVTHGTFHKLGR